MQTGQIQLQVLVFELAGRSCGFATDDVLEVMRAVAIEPLPQAPAIVEGVINRRGGIVPVLNVAARFGLTPRALSASDQLIVVRASEPVAVRVDRCVAISNVAMVRHEQALALPPGVMHVAGFALVPEGVMVVFDLRAFLSAQESQALDAALEAEAGKRRRSSQEQPA